MRLPLKLFSSGFARNDAVAGLCASLLSMAALSMAPAWSAQASAGLIPASLITEALEIDQQTRARHAAAPVTGDVATVTVYVDSHVPRLMLLEMTLQIDTDQPIRHRYGEAESLALQTQAVHRLASVATTAGKHHLYAEYVARYPEDKPGTPRLRATLVRDWEQPAGGLAMELSLGEAGLFGGRPQLTQRQWTPVPDGLDDAELHSIDLMIASGRELDAAEDLLDLRRRSGGALPDAFAQRLNASLALLQGAAGSPAPIEPAPAQATAFSQYDSAAASGDVAMLDRLGRQEALDERSLALRDKANAALGFHLLESGQGKSADEALRRVRSPGPYSEVALLGLGWAQLVASQSSGAKAAPVKTALSTQSSSFSSLWAIAGDKQAEDLRRALVPWTELIGRDPTQAPVQEAMLAIPYAMDHLGAHRQAQLYTTRAIDKLENTRAHLAAALEHIASGRMVALAVERDAPDDNGWAWWLAALPEPRWWLSAPPGAPDNFYMERLLQDDEFRSQLQVSRRLYELDRLLAQDIAALADQPDAQQQLNARINALRPQLASLAAAQRRELEGTATREVQALKRQTENYLVEAHFAMARLNDRPADSASKPWSGSKQ